MRSMLSSFCLVFVLLVIHPDAVAAQQNQLVNSNDPNQPPPPPQQQLPATQPTHRGPPDSDGIIHIYGKPSMTDQQGNLIPHPNDKTAPSANDRVPADQDGIQRIYGKPTFDQQAKSSSSCSSSRDKSDGSAGKPLRPATKQATTKERSAANTREASWTTTGLIITATIGATWWQAL